MQRVRAIAHNSRTRPRITTFTLSEMMFGALEKKQKTRAIQQLAKFKVSHTNMKSSFLYAQIKHATQTSGIALSDIDMLIASIVMSHDGTLITKDKAFASIPKLKVQVIE